MSSPSCALFLPAVPGRQSFSRHEWPASRATCCCWLPRPLSSCGCWQTCSMAWSRLKEGCRRNPERSSTTCRTVFRMLILVPAGYAVASLWYGPELGWSAALLAIFTAYVRMLGGASGLQQSFVGPMAKPHRMATLTIACVLSLFEGAFLRFGMVLWVALILINVGCVVTIWRRTARIVRGLESR